MQFYGFFVVFCGKFCGITVCIVQYKPQHWIEIKNNDNVIFENIECNVEEIQLMNNNWILHLKCNDSGVTSEVSNLNVVYLYPKIPQMDGGNNEETLQEIMEMIDDPIENETDIDASLHDLDKIMPDTTTTSSAHGINYENGVALEASSL